MEDYIGRSMIIYLYQIQRSVTKKKNQTYNKQLHDIPDAPGCTRPIFVSFFFNIIYILNNLKSRIILNIPFQLTKMFDVHRTHFSVTRSNTNSK